MSDDHVDRALEALGRQPVEPPTAAYADDLEQRLRAQHADRRDGVVPLPARHSSPRAWRAVAVAAAVLVLAGVAAAIAPDSSPTDVVLASATGTSLVLPDGTVVDAAAGLELPDGTVIITGDDGRAEVDGLVIGPGRTAVVENGRVRLLAREPGTSPTTETTDGGGVPTTARPPTTRPAPALTTTTRPPPLTTTTVKPRPPAVRLALTATRQDRRAVALRWSRYGGDDFARYVVVRTINAGDDQAQVFSTTSPTTVTFTDRLPEGTTQAGYRVIALDGDGHVVGASAVTRV